MPGHVRTRTLFLPDAVRSRVVIARAIELDAQRVTTSTAELRLIAAEIGISPDSVEAALREYARNAEPTVRKSSTHAASAIVAAGVPLGIAAGTLLGTASPLALLATLPIVAVGLVASGADWLARLVRRGTVVRAPSSDDRPRFVQSVSA